MIVRNKGEFIRNGLGLRLLPGTNVVDPTDWKRFVSHPLNQLLVDEGELVPNQTDEGEARKLSDMNAAETVETIKDTFDLSVLDALYEEESTAEKPRETVLKAIQKQVAAIEKEIEDAKDKK
jgi:hypothetical protein